MKIQTAIYYHFLFRRSLVFALVFLFLFLVFSLVIFFSNFLNLTTTILIIFFFSALLVFSIASTITWFFKYKSTIKKIDDIELFKRIKYGVISDLVLKSGIKIKYIVPKKNQEKIFFQIIQPEIEKQKKLISILKDKK